jgi:hypothetical protein
VTPPLHIHEKIDGLRLIFTNFNIPALTTRQLLCEAALYISVEVSDIATNIAVHTDGDGGRNFLQIIKCAGQNGTV